MATAFLLAAGTNLSPIAKERMVLSMYRSGSGQSTDPDLVHMVRALVVAVGSFAHFLFFTRSGPSVRRLRSRDRNNRRAVITDVLRCRIRRRTNVQINTRLWIGKVVRIRWRNKGR